MHSECVNESILFVVKTELVTFASISIHILITLEVDRRSQQQTIPTRAMDELPNITWSTLWSNQNTARGMNT